MERGGDGGGDMCAAAGGERNFAPGGQILALSGPRDPDFSGSLKAPRRILATLRTPSLKFKGRRTCSLTTTRRTPFYFSSLLAAPNVS